ncbi:hypothetical protein [Streptomyces sp. NPDC003247]|uniref:hypothetical protein n=1 Tax=Streptomyces sp. NPDC003247 TaxID=3364677 RepID=UPI0036835B5D
MATPWRRSGSERTASSSPCGPTSTGAGDVGFEILVGCPADDGCEGQAWAPVYNVTDLLRALTGELMNDPDLRRTIHGGADDVDQIADDHDLQDHDPEGRADLEAQCADAVRT